MLQQIPSSEWIGNGSEISLCQLPLSVADVESLFSVSFVPLEPQLPDYSYAVVRIEGHVFLLAGAREAFAGSDHSFVSIQARGDIRDPSVLVDAVCSEFAVLRDELRWLSSELSVREWCLWRLDDNGVREPMWYFVDAGLADAVARRYSERGHKQLYYVERAV